MSKIILFFVENVIMILIIYFKITKRTKYILKVFKLNILFFCYKMTEVKKVPKKRGRKPKKKNPNEPKPPPKKEEENLKEVK